MHHVYQNAQMHNNIKIPKLINAKHVFSHANHAKKTMAKNVSLV